MPIIFTTLHSKEKGGGLKALYTEHALAMAKAASEILQDEHLAGEAVQETFIRIADNLDKIMAADDNKKRGLLALMVRSAADALARRSKEQPACSACKDPAGQAAGAESPIEGILTNSEILARVAAKIKQIPPSLADILALKYFYHYQDEEISQLLNLTPENSRARLENARKSLLNLLAPEPAPARSSRSDCDPVIVQLKEKMVEILFEYAAACHVENMDNMLAHLPEDDPAFLLPPEFDLKMKTLIAGFAKKETLHKIKKKLPQVLIFLVVLFGSLTILVASVDALRVKALNIILSVHEQYTSIRIPVENNGATAQAGRSQTQDRPVYDPGYIPAGFTAEKTEQRSLLKESRYSNPQGQTIRFTQYFNGNTDLRIDTENAAVQHMSIHKSDALVAEKQGIVSIVWQEDYLLSLIGEASKAEMVKMAESVHKKSP
jgi:RNA polymerase sigma factor (sigma-70 family)